MSVKYFGTCVELSNYFRYMLIVPKVLHLKLTIVHHFLDFTSFDNALGPKVERLKKLIETHPKTLRQYDRRLQK